MAAGETLAIAGLTFTAGTSGATAAQVSSAFANINTGASVTFTSSSANTNVTNLTSTVAEGTSAPAIVTTDGVASTSNETAAVTFKPLAAGQSLTMAGLTFTSGTAGTTANQLASAFASITNGTAGTAINTAKTLNDVAGGTFTAGTATGWGSGTATGAAVTFTSSSVNTNVSNLTSTLSIGTSAPAIVTTDGVASTSNETAAVTFKPLAAGQSLTMAGLTFTSGANGTTAAQLASAFASITNGTAGTDINTAKTLNDLAGGTFTAGTATGWGSGTAAGDTASNINTAKTLNAAAGGTFTNGTAAGWSSGTATNSLVTFLSSTASESVSNLTASGSLANNLPTITMNDFPSITTWKEGYSGYSAFTTNKLIAENFVSLAPTDPLSYYNSGNVLTPKISSLNANTAQLKSSFLGNLVADLVTDVGVQVAGWKNTKKADDVVLANLKEQRDQLSGVNLDEEAANLLRYQQLYSASTKILQTGNQMFNTLLAIMN